jgi:hypothetical protein
LAKSEEGEFELILGNRQLISVFLIVVVLLGVFFSMGYIVGRNSSSGAAEARNAGKLTPVESPPAADSTASSPAQDTPATPQETAPPPAAAPATTHPEQPAPSKPAPVNPPPVIAAKPKPAAVGPASVAGDIAPGNYWQVVATARPECEIIAEALTKKGFHALVAPGPREGVFRVLVGPFKDSASQAQLRTALEAADFKNPIVRKY